MRMQVKYLNFDYLTLLLLIGHCMNNETTLFIYLTYMSKYGTNGPILKT